jgi:tetratricopeptide (TPR) repeat protein
MLTLSERIANNADNMFMVGSDRQSQIDSVANSALSRGITKYQNGNIDGAIVEFKRSVALSPYSDNSLKTYQFLATAYQKQGKTDDAIKAYKQASSLFPTSAVPHAQMGLIYFNQKNFTAAETEYSKAVKLSPNQASTHYSLGQVYIAEGKYTDAVTQFKRVTALSPADSSGYYALGQVYRKLGQYDAAATQLNKAVALDNKYSDAHLELGMTYADMKRTDKANDQVTILSELNQSQSVELQNYLKAAALPKLVAAYSSSGFYTSYGPGTLVENMDSTLSTPAASKIFTMNFTFSKPMDADSVQTSANWLINRASGSEGGGAYNWGLAVKSTEINISPIPLNVTYNADTLSATVMFRVTQNSDASGTLDPSHIMFKFSGVDAQGNSMDESSDQYGGISKIV